MITTVGKQLAEQIVDTVHDVCGYDINFINKNGIIYASTNTSRIGSFHEIGKKVADTKTTIEVWEDDKYKGTSAGVNIPVTHNGFLIAVIGISGAPDEVRKFACLAEKITRLLIREKELNAVSRTLTEKRNYLISCLISEDIPTETSEMDYIHTLLQEFHIDESGGKRVFILKIASEVTSASLSLMEDKILHFFSDFAIELFMFQHPNEYIVVIDESFPLTVLYHFCQNNHENIQIGIGRSAKIFQLNTSFATAKTALQSLKYSDKPIALFDDLTLEILLGSVSSKASEEFLKKTIAKLDEADITLLHCYFEHERSLTQTAAVLFLHKNTLQYRLDRISRICGLNPRKFKDGVILYLAIQLGNL